MTRPTTRRGRSRVLACAFAVLAAVTVAGCGSSGTPAVSESSVAGVVVGHEQPPDLKAFFAHPVATPSTCPSGANGTTTGLRSPWVGHVDISVFFDPSVSPATRSRLDRTLEAEPLVSTVYVESSSEAYREFQRLYTCSGQLSPSQIPSSLRVVLTEAASLGDRDSLVTRLVHSQGVTSVSCDPSLPCTSTVRAALASPGPGLSPGPTASASPSASSR